MLSSVCSLLTVALLLGGARASDGLGCYSSVDTSVSKGYNKWQSLSACAESCGSSYPYVAIRDGAYCYCLLLMPTDETSSSNCNVVCNGYGYDTCGGSSAYTVFTGEGTASSAASLLLALLALLAALLLALLSSSSSSSSSASSSSSSSASSSSSSSSSSLATSSSSETLTSATSVLSSSAMSTVTKTASATVSSSATASASSSSSSGGSKKSTNTGAIAGGVAGGVVAAALIAVAVFFVMRRRGSDDDHEEELYEKSPGSGGGATQPHPAFDMPLANPFSDPFTDKRASNMTAAPLSDPRLNPAMMGRRRILDGLLADETDYSRKILAVANP